MPSQPPNIEPTKLPDWYRLVPPADEPKAKLKAKYKPGAPLIVLDINGTLVHRSAFKKEPNGLVEPLLQQTLEEQYAVHGDFHFRKRTTWFRPYMDHFLHTLLRHYNVAIWYLFIVCACVASYIDVAFS